MPRILLFKKPPPRDNSHLVELRRLLMARDRFDEFLLKIEQHRALVVSAREIAPRRLAGGHP